MRQALTFSSLLHCLVMALAFQIMSSNGGGRKNYYVLDLNVSTFAPPSGGAQSQSWSLPSEIIAPKENRDFLSQKSQAKDQRPQEPPPESRRPSSSIKPSASALRSSHGPGSGTASVGAGQGMKHFPYPSYMEMVRKKISVNWQASFWRDNRLPRKAQVMFLVHRDGSISSPQLSEKSGDASYDLTCLRSIQLAAPFPPLPEGLSDRHVRIIFDFEISE